MKALLICPAARPALAALAEAAPLANAVILGKPLIEYWLEDLAVRGAREVHVLATDRPEKVRRLVGGGARWGLRVTVHPEIRELTAAEARAKYRPADENGWLSLPHDASLMDCLPGQPEFPLLGGYAEWFAAVQAWLPRAATPDRIGVREIQPGVWVGLRTRILPGAQLRAPCWLGAGVTVGPGAVIGPQAVVEDRAMIDAGAEISRSIVGAESFVGGLTDVKNSIAWGGTLVNWKLNSCIKVADTFLLCPLGRRRAAFRPVGPLGRSAALVAIALTLPLALLAMLRLRLRSRRVFRPQLAVRPRSAAALPLPGDTVVYYELGHAHGWLRRWPQLWNILRGDFGWIGNRPLSPGHAARLANDFEQLWLAAPTGLISLADAEGCGNFFTCQARAHASFYAVQASRWLNLVIFVRALFLLASGIPFSQARALFVPHLKPARAGN